MLGLVSFPYTLVDQSAVPNGICLGESAFGEEFVHFLQDVDLFHDGLAGDRRPVDVFDVFHLVLELLGDR